MRTTINLDDQLLTEAKLLAQQSGTTFTAVVSDALRERLARNQATSQTDKPFQLHTFAGAGLQPGVDLDNTAAVRDLMDDLA